jgi:D-alanyl-lipoteichoic acid acyltransferase DltB (MBOAT superfamily)
MLFNSYAFLLLFLPVTLIGYFVIGKTLGRGAVFGWLVAASLFFYGWWNWFNLSLLLASLVFNYIAGTWLSKLDKRPPAKIVLGLALAFNIGFLGYFKYADFFISNVNALTGATWALTHVVLPLGISFYTFQKIAYLVDSFQGKTRGYGFRDFCLFVSFFPQLIAGPITHHSENHAAVPQAGYRARSLGRLERRAHALHSRPRQKSFAGRSPRFDCDAGLPCREHRR